MEVAGRTGRGECGWLGRRAGGAKESFSCLSSRLNQDDVIVGQLGGTELKNMPYTKFWPCSARSTAIGLAGITIAGRIIDL